MFRRPPRVVRRLAAAHRTHKQAQHGRVVFCLACGTSPRYGARQREWQHQPCQGEVPPLAFPKRVRRVIALGLQGSEGRTWERRWPERTQQLRASCESEGVDALQVAGGVRRALQPLRSRGLVI